MFKTIIDFYKLDIFRNISRVRYLHKSKEWENIIREPYNIEQLPIKCEGEKNEGRNYFKIIQNIAT